MSVRSSYGRDGKRSVTRPGGPGRLRLPPADRDRTVYSKIGSEVFFSPRRCTIGIIPRIGRFAAMNRA